MQTEITVEVFENVEDVTKKLQNQGFVIKEKYGLNDFYFSKYSLTELKNMDYKDLIANSFVVREILDGKQKPEIVYKNKVVDENNVVLSEQKVKTKLDSLENCLQIFKLAGLTCWCELIQTIYVFKKGDIELLLQKVENLGSFIEYEETEKMKDLSERQKIDYLLDDLKKLNLNISNDYSCKKVYMKFKKDNNIK